MIHTTLVSMLIVMAELTRRGYVFYLDEDNAGDGRICYTPPSGFGYGVFMKPGWMDRRE